MAGKEKVRCPECGAFMKRCESDMPCCYCGYYYWYECPKCGYTICPGCEAIENMAIELGKSFEEVSKQILKELGWA